MLNSSPLLQAVCVKVVPSLITRKGSDLLSFLEFLKTYAALYMFSKLLAINFASKLVKRDWKSVCLLPCSLFICIVQYIPVTPLLSWSIWIGAPLKFARSEENHDQAPERYLEVQGDYDWSNQEVVRIKEILHQDSRLLDEKHDPDLHKVNHAAQEVVLSISPDGFSITYLENLSTHD